MDTTADRSVEDGWWCTWQRGQQHMELQDRSAVSMALATASHEVLFCMVDVSAPYRTGFYMSDGVAAGELTICTAAGTAQCGTAVGTADRVVADTTAVYTPGRRGRKEWQCAQQARQRWNSWWFAH